MEPKLTAAEDASPGATLSRARTERGLSIDEVAQALRLSPRIVSALEEDAYERLPGPTYVRGYLRSYAQFLELPVHPLLEGFNHRPEANRRTEIKGRAPVRQATASDAAVRLASVAVAVVVFGLAALWWSGHDVSPVSEEGPIAAEPLYAPLPDAEPAPEIADPVATAAAPTAEPAPEPGSTQAPAPVEAAAAPAQPVTPEAPAAAPSGPDPAAAPGVPRAR